MARRLEIIRNGSDADAERTIQNMENRIYGKATERVEQTHTVDTVGLTRDRIRAMSSAERLALLARLQPDVLELEPGDVTEVD